ncbi:MAG: hypothetical protein V4501_12265 [Pseudomonadota bacterium]
MSSKLITGSMCLTDLNSAAKAGHSAFNRSEKNGKIYFNFAEWINDEADQYGNHAAFKLNPVKDKQETEGKVYFGNGKEKVTEKPLTPGDKSIPDDDDLPF